MMLLAEFLIMSLSFGILWAAEDSGECCPSVAVDNEMLFLDGMMDNATADSLNCQSPCIYKRENETKRFCLGIKDSCSKIAGEGLNISANVDDMFMLFADGKKVLSGKGWRTTFIVKLDYMPKVLAIHAIDKGGRAGLNVELSNGVVSDRSWRCTDQYSPGWSEVDFDDEMWDPAYEIPNPVWQRFTKKANWIWNNKSEEDLEIYCRKSL